MATFTTFRGSKSGEIVQSTTTREIRHDEVLVKITYSGLCGTDEHSRHDDMVLGHEGVGTIEEMGRDVKGFTKGDVVGWGYQHNSCGDCTQCLTGRETLCRKRELYSFDNLDQGSFGSHAVWNANFVFKIPESIEGRFAAPLMCGGATVFNVLHSFNVKSTDRVGIIGVGGLGHLAIQFAAKMGCDVVVFSQTHSKEKEAMALGANEFIATKGQKELNVREPIHHLIVTTSQQPDWKQYLGILAPGATIYPLTVSAGDFSMPYMPILMEEFTVQGSFVATRQVQKEMLAFAAKHEIRPTTEQFPMTKKGITESMEKLQAGNMRYRGVLVAQ